MMQKEREGKEIKTRSGEQESPGDARIYPSARQRSYKHGNTGTILVLKAWILE